MKLFLKNFALFLVLFTTLLFIKNANAADATCTVSVNAGIVNFGNLTLINIENINIPAILNYTCTNNDLTPRYITVCLSVGDGDGGNGSGNILPRYMKHTNDSSARLAFTMTLPGNRLWGSRFISNSNEYKSQEYRVNGRSSFTDSVEINISILPNYNNHLAKPGTYINNFNSGHTLMTVQDRLLSISSDCSSGGSTTGQFPFKVQATVIPSCEITSTSDINLGIFSAGNQNISGTNNFDVRCTNSVPYYIGLAPSNKNNLGSGIMNGTSGNLDKLSYQLRSTNGLEGKIWGNTATSTNVGNGVSGIGTGSTNTHPIYVTVPQTDVRPDNYSDTVDIRVNY